MHLSPRAPRHAVLDLLAHDGPITNDGVGVKLDDEVGGACAQQLWGRDGGGRLCEDRRKRRSLLMLPCGPRTPIFRLLAIPNSQARIWGTPAHLLG